MQARGILANLPLVYEPLRAAPERSVGSGGPGAFLARAPEIFCAVHCTIAPHELRYCRPVDPDEELYLLAGARCPLLTSLVAQTNSLAAMEALRLGNPGKRIPTFAARWPAGYSIRRGRSNECAALSSSRVPHDNGDPCPRRKFHLPPPSLAGQRFPNLTMRGEIHGVSRRWR